MFLFHDSAAEDNPLRREHTDEIHQAERNIMRLQFPCFMTRRKVLRRDPPASGNCRAGCHAFKAVMMERAFAFVYIIRTARNTDMSHFRMHQPVHKPALHHSPAADARTDRHVYEIGQATRGTPFLFSQRRGIHISVKTYRNTQFTFQPLGKISVLPSGFRG